MRMTGSLRHGARSISTRRNPYLVEQAEADEILVDPKED